MRKQIPDWKLVSDAMRLVYLAETDFSVCNKLYEHIDPQNRHDYYDFLLLTANNAFHESVGIIHTLLCSKKDEEVRIEPILRAVISREKHPVPTIPPAKVEEFLKRIEKDYPADSTDFETYTFLQVDDKREIGNIMADIRRKKRIESGLTDLAELRKQFEKDGFHKIRHQAVAHKNIYLDEPAGAVIGIIKPQFIKKLEDIVKKLRINCSIWFDHSFINPNVATSRSLETTITRIFGKKPQ